MVTLGAAATSFCRPGKNFASPSGRAKTPPWLPVATGTGSVEPAATSRCGGAGSSCLTVVEVNNGDSDPADCIVRSISYRPEPGPADAPDGEKKLQRGTTVTVTSDCTSPEEETSGSDD